MCTARIFHKYVYLLCIYGILYWFTHIAGRVWHDRRSRAGEQTEITGRILAAVSLPFAFCDRVVDSKDPRPTPNGLIHSSSFYPSIPLTFYPVLHISPLYLPTYFPIDLRQYMDTTSFRRKNNKKKNVDSLFCPKPFRQI